jgi:hypothetical protein
VTGPDRSTRTAPDPPVLIRGDSVPAERPAVFALGDDPPDPPVLALGDDPPVVIGG